jgi:Mor family transcriptional regulator
MENEFINDFKLLSGKDLENKYDMSRRLLVKCIKKIYKKNSSQLLDKATSLEDIKVILGGILYSDPKKRIPLEREQEFNNDIKIGLKRRSLCKKYKIGTTVFYKELQRLCGVKKLTDIRNTEYYSPPIKEYITAEREKEFIKDLKKLSGKQLEIKYNITHRYRLIREINRVLNKTNLVSMEDVKKFVGGEIYNSSKFKKDIPKEREKEFRIDIKKGLTRRELCEKYKFSTKVLYRELNRLFNTKSLDEARTYK